MVESTEKAQILQINDNVKKLKLPGLISKQFGIYRLPFSGFCSPFASLRCAYFSSKYVACTSNVSSADSRPYLFYLTFEAREGCLNFS